MQKAVKSDARTKRRLQPLSVQEAMAGPSLSGLDDVLKTMVEPILPTPAANTNPRLMLVSPGVVKSPDDIKSPGDTKATHKKKAPLRHSRAPVEMERVQQGLNASEQAVYQFLFAEERDAEGRVFKPSIPEIAAKTGLSKRTCQRVLHELSEKRVIEIVPPSYRSVEPCKYIVRSYEAIRQIWGKLGFTHVLGNRTRILIDPMNPGRQLGGKSQSEQSNESVGIAENTTVSPGDFMSSGDLVTPPPGVMKSPLSIKGNIYRNKYKETTTSAVDVVAVVAAICEFLPGDRTAAEQIIESAIALCPDCTTADVVTAIQRKVAQIRAQEGIKNPVAVLKASCSDLVVAVRAERLAAEAQQSNETAREKQAIKHAAFLSSLHGLPANNEWQQILGNIRHHIPTHAYETWLKPIQFANCSDRILLVCVPSHEFKHVGEKYAGPISRAIQTLALDIAAIKYLTIDELIRKEEQTDAH